MTDPRSLRLVMEEIRGGLERYGQAELTEILTYVFKEFVVEGSSPLGVGAGALLDARTELAGMSFAQLVTWLQHHLDLPELALFEVAGERVSVRAGGRALPIEAPRTEPPAAAEPPRPTPAPAAPAPAPMAIAEARPVTTAPARPTAPASPAPVPAAPTPSPAAPAAAPAASKSDEPSESDSRFSRLEVD